MNALRTSIALCGAVCGALALGASGCDGEEGVPSAPSIDADVPRVPRDAGAADAGAPPGDGGPWFREGAGLRRRPYLQNVTTTVARIMWTSTALGPGSVRLRARGDSRTLTVNAAYELFPKERTGDTEDYGSYVATVRGLTPDTDYDYEVWGDRTLLATGLSLHTAWTRADKPLRILAFGDSGTGSAAQYAVRDQFMRRRYDAFFHLGDIAYPSGSYDQFEAYFFSVYRDLLQAVPVYPVIGNHEYLTLGGQPFVDVYHLPATALRPEDDERYYSFDLGDVHVVALDSNPQMLWRVSDQVDDDMVDWLRADLAASRATWKLALFHHPIYSSGPHGGELLARQTLVEVLEDGGVDLVLNGHDHDYERTHPVWRGAQVPPEDKRAITYVVAGAGGGALYAANGDWFTQVVDAKSYSFLDLTIEGCFATGNAITADGQVIDAFTIDGCEN